MDAAELQNSCEAPLPATFDFLGRSTEWMLGRTPPEAMVTPPRNLLSSSSLRTARTRCRGVTRFFLLSRQAYGRTEWM